MRFPIAVSAAFLICTVAWAQSSDPDLSSKESHHTVDGWFGAYTKYRVSEKVFYYGEYHYRRRNFMRDMAQIYLRFGATYLINKNLEVTAGMVTPVYWAPDQTKENIDPVVMQYRLWEQLLFVQPFKRLKLYHQLRFEQRWRRAYEKDSPFLLTYRFRYKIMTYIPMNRPTLINRTLFLSAYEEIFIQAGNSIIYDHFEDNRVFLGLGYIINENFQVQAGYMWTFRHAGAPNKYEHRHIPRLSIYHNLDFYGKRQEKNRQRQVRILNDDF